jgi:ABC-type multidrug transport system fused ATPase/permease subunit
VNELRRTLRRGRATIKTLAPYGRPHRRYLIEGSVATLVLVAARLAFPWPLRGLLEIVYQRGAGGRGGSVVALLPGRGDPVVWLVGAFVLIILVWGVAESLQRLAYTRFAGGLVRDIRIQALRRLPDAKVGGPVAGDVISTVTGDASHLKSGLKSILITTSRNGAFFFGVATIVALIDPLVGLVFLTGGLATVAAGGWGASRSSYIMRRSRRREGALTDDLHHFLSGQADLSKPKRDRTRHDSKVTRVEGVTTFIVHVILAISTCAILVLTIHTGRNGGLSPGSVFTILAYIMLMHNKTVSLGRGIVRAGKVLPSAERIAGLAKAPRRKPSNLGNEPEANAVGTSPLSPSGAHRATPITGHDA